MLTAVDHVQLAVPRGSEDLLRAYYVDVLGMTETPSRRCSRPGATAGSGRGPWSCTWGSRTPAP